MKKIEVEKLVIFFGVGVISILVAVLTDILIASKEIAFGITFLSGLIGVTFLAMGIFVFIPRYMYMKKMLEGKELIATWKLTEEDVLENAANIEKKKKEENFATFVFIAATCFITGIVFLFILNGKPLFYIMIAIILISYIITIISPKIAYFNAIKRGNFVYIGKNAIYANGTYYSLKGISEKRDNIKIYRGDRYMRFKYLYYSNIGKESKYITIRIPKDNIQEVDKVLEYYKF